MKAQITIEKTFDETRGFTKEYEQGDFKEFFNDEGEYMDNLADTLKKAGKAGNSFQIIYTVTLTR